jgi:hypothetical protein
LNSQFWNVLQINFPASILWKLWFFWIFYFLRVCPFFVDSVDSFGKRNEKKKLRNQYWSRAKLYIILNTDYGYPLWSLFSSKSQTFGAFGVFSSDLSALSFWYCTVSPLCLPLINHYFYKKLSLYIQIPNIYLWLGFEFGPQRIRDLAIVCL